MFRTIVLGAICLAATTVSAQAHEVWLERDATTLHVYLGDPDGKPDPEAAPRLTGGQLLVSGKSQSVSYQLQSDHQTTTVAANGDVRWQHNTVWEPWKTDDGKSQAAVYHARYGRSETTGGEGYEFVPVAANSDTFVLKFQGQPVANKTVKLVDPDKWTRQVATDGEGRITVPARSKGEYILIAENETPADVTVGGQKVDSLLHIATLTYVAD
ncbi:MAG: hypothetical protein QM647_02685 [Asticcacaulis sp.]|uniref:hypothetical protein n=1 Tax=Asticcacaulis sp. TaxID=1872648 RepID=UPI0039E68FF4